MKKNYNIYIVDYNNINDNNEIKYTIVQIIKE